MTSTLWPIFPAIDDVLFNFAQSDGLSQANQVNSARNQGLTAPELNTVVFLDAGVTDYQSLQAGVIPEVATVILTPNQDGIEQITAFLQQNPQITTTTSIIKSVRYAIALHSLRVSKQLK
jgi:hypothetical protein